MNLVTCSGCARHVRSSETECPFCGVSREPVAKVSVSTVTGGRAVRDRSALLFGAAAVASALGVAACEPSVVAMYGGPPPRDSAPQPPSPPDAGASSTPDAAPPPVTVAPAYGAPVMPTSADPPAPPSPVAPAYGAPVIHAPPPKK